MASYDSLPPVLYEMEPEEKDQEIRIEFFLEAFRGYIAQTVDYKDLMFFKYFSPDDRKKFRSLAKNAGNADVTEQMIDTILLMKDKPNRYSSLVVLFENELENEKVLRILKGEKIPTNSKHQKSNIHKVMEAICDQLIVGDIIPHLECHRLIVLREKERLLKLERNKSNFDAALDLISILPNRQEHWYPKFILCLIESGHEFLAKKVDKDVYEKIMKYKEEKNIQNSDRSLSFEDQNELLELYEDFGETSLMTLHDTYRSSEETDVKDFNKGELSLASLPEEILNMDDTSVRLYKKALKDGKEEINSIRVMIVGHCGVGKTTLTKRLLGEQVDIANSMTSTNGIEVHSKRCKILLAEREWQPTKTENSEETMYNRIFSLMKNISNEAKLEKEDANHENRDEENLSANEIKIIEHKHITEKDVVVPPMHEEKRVTKDAVTILKNEDLKSLEEEIDVEVQLTDLIQDVVNRSTSEHNRDIADLSIWDFAGQYVFYATHQIFLSRRAIYLLVTDLTKHLDNLVQDDCFVDAKGRTDCNMSEFVTFWLNSIHTFCESGKKGEPPVILVGTFADKLPKKKREDISDEFFTKVRETLAYSDTFEHLWDHANFAIDNSIVDPNVEQLKKMIVDIATKQSYWSELYPTRWVVLERSLVIFKRQGLKILPKKILELTSRNLPHPIDNEEFELFLRFHHETGYILYFSEENLKDHIILEPQWLVDALKSFITARQFCTKKSDLCRMWLDFNNTAILKKDLIDAVWSEETPFKEHQDLILDYMEKLAIISRPRQSLDSGCMLEDFYFVPCFLKQTVPDKLLEIDEQECKSTSRLCFTTRSRIIPIQLFNKLLAECITKWPISKQNGQYLIFCGCAVFDVANLHVLYIYLRDSVIQIWITKYSKSETEPDIGVCSDAKAFITDSLNTGSNVSSKLEMYVACQKSSFKTTENMFKVDDLLQKEECLCNSHDRRHIVSKSTLLKCWFPEQFEYQSDYSDEFLKSVPTEKDLSRLAHRIGKEYRSLGIELGLTSPELDHVEMEERNRTSVDKITAMLSEWAKKNSDDATFQVLKRAMVATGIDWKCVFEGLK